MSNDNIILLSDILPEDQEANFGNVSDGSHTFNELYAARAAYNALLFNTWANSNKSTTFMPHKSRRHHDKSQIRGGKQFVVAAMLPSGPIFNHYFIESDWDKFQIREYDKCLFEWDGNSGDSNIVARLSDLL